MNIHASLDMRKFNFFRNSLINFYSNATSIFNKFYLILTKLLRINVNLMNKYKYLFYFLKLEQCSGEFRGEKVEIF